MKSASNQSVAYWQSQSSSLTLPCVFAREVWNFYAGGSLHRKILIEINEKEEGALSIICMRPAPT